MFVAIITGFVSIFVSVITASVSYFFTKKQEREVAWHSNKMNYYKAFIGSINGVLEGNNSREGREEFSRACNDLLLFAPQNVLEAMFKYLDCTKIGATKEDAEKHDELFSNLVFLIRMDLDVLGDDANFKVILWSPGKKRAD